MQSKSQPAPATVEKYIALFPRSTAEILRTLRELVLDIAEDAEESISYKMPTYKVNGKPLVYFAAYDHHIGFYATPTGHEEFEEELSQYKRGKGSVQFPLDRPMPYALIKKMVKFNLKERRAALKKK